MCSKWSLYNVVISVLSLISLNLKQGFAIYFQCIAMERYCTKYILILLKKICQNGHVLLMRIKVQVSDQQMSSAE
jgi:hypothetical protein